MSNKAAPQPDNDDLTNPKVAVSCLDFLLIELVPLAQRITDQLHAREQALLDDFSRSKIFNHGKANDTSTIAVTGKPAPRDSNVPAITVTEGNASSVKGSEVSTTVGDGRSSVGGPGNAPTGMDEATREAMFWRLDGLGYRVGQGLAERFSVGKPRPQTPLDAIKFICKDLWTLLFRKQIDNLKTNHRGVFVLTDSRFQPLSRMSVDRRAGSKAGEEALRKAQTYLYFPCGVIRGALAGLGMEVTVTADTADIPAATFQIKTKGAKS
ncbi:related to TRS33-TRAPP subunit of 33 kDa involved in targeting and fusion of ER to golgi transp [Ramularia collo-cygni]|uniref:Related to TRS33-TRAPP subunit of 33 kDa involved in targeting and fusion of ER to golgi transp n=1 Tax=Ramularia collo-cygni TaxID=112498 RepID=A0A2D3VHB5_9PEZI|nr:related to TRS33-TRAPP subunit of 33 kDa involved in targeting and fusion of ER to golgi transp [Ramularia collo-cygni]CZT21329.1 related to TRS33-TRAPP subunit of 33 kDa involved in targeting and fusion of ER to golgi transp [Ramularia collo-cygni]